MANKKRNKKRNPYKFLESMINGLMVSWTDEEPAISGNKSLSKSEYSHKNPIHRPFTKQIISTFIDRLARTKQMMWKVDMTTVFSYESGDDLHLSSIEFFGVLDDIHDVLLETLSSDRLKGDKMAYKHVKFDMECIGRNPPRNVEHDIRDELLLINR